MYQTRHTFASNALAAGDSPSWVAAMLGHSSPEMLFSAYARYIPNRTRRDGSALLSRMTERRQAAAPEAAGVAVLPKGRALPVKLGWSMTYRSVVPKGGFARAPLRHTQPSAGFS